MKKWKKDDLESIESDDEGCLYRMAIVAEKHSSITKTTKIKDFNSYLINQ